MCNVISEGRRVKLYQDGERVLAVLDCFRVYDVMKFELDDFVHTLEEFLTFCDSSGLHRDEVPSVFVAYVLCFAGYLQKKNDFFFMRGRGRLRRLLNAI